MKKRSKVASVRTDIPPNAAPAGYWTRFESFLARWAIWLAIGLVALGTGRIVSTYTIFSHTFDEPADIACGMEWLEKHTYTYEPAHPPLARVMTAVLPKIFGAHGWNKKSMWDDGLAILFSRGTEDFNLALARTGMLPFFWITCWIAYSCTRWISGSAPAAVLAIFLVSMTPTVLAHAGLAKTDMALTAMLLLAVYTGWRWMEDPVWRRAAAFGTAAGLERFHENKAKLDASSWNWRGCSHNFTDNHLATPPNAGCRLPAASLKGHDLPNRFAIRQSIKCFVQSFE